MQVLMLTNDDEVGSADVTLYEDTAEGMARAMHDVEVTTDSALWTECFGHGLLGSWTNGSRYLTLTREDVLTWNK